MVSDRELFELRSGRIIMDEDLSEKMYIIKEYHPERADDSSSDFFAKNIPTCGNCFSNGIGTHRLHSSPMDELSTTMT